MQVVFTHHDLCQSNKLGYPLFHDCLCMRGEESTKLACKKFLLYDVVSLQVPELTKVFGCLSVFASRAWTKLKPCVSRKRPVWQWLHKFISPLSSYPHVHRC